MYYAILKISTTLCTHIHIIYRCGKKRKNILCLPMWKCMMNNDSSTINHFNRSDQLSSLNPLPPGQYNSLQHNYGNDRNLSSNDNLLITPDEHSPSAMPLDHHDANSFAHSSNSEIHLNHTTSTTLSNHSSITIQDNGYVLPDNCGKAPHNIISKNFGTKNKTKNATHKPTVILKSDGTGLIRTSNLEAIIPFRNDDYEVTQSQTHESYFDIKKR